MLVLTRKKGERVRVGDDVVVTVVEIDGNRIRIGIDAPQDLRISREDAQERPKGEGFLGV